MTVHQYVCILLYNNQTCQVATLNPMNHFVEVEPLVVSYGFCRIIEKKKIVKTWNVASLYVFIFCCIDSIVLQFQVVSCTNFVKLSIV